MASKKRPSAASPFLRDRLPEWTKPSEAPPDDEFLDRLDRELAAAGVGLSDDGERVIVRDPFDARAIENIVIDAVKHPELACMARIATILEPFCKAHRARLLAAASIVQAPNTFTDAELANLLAVGRGPCECIR